MASLESAATDSEDESDEDSYESGDSEHDSQGRRRHSSVGSDGMAEEAAIAEAADLLLLEQRMSQRREWPENRLKASAYCTIEGT